MAAKIEPLLTIEDLDACPDDGNRYELIGGELFVSRAPRIPHQRILLNLQKAFLNYLDQNSVGIIVPGAGAVFSEYDAVIPDLVFVCNERWDEIVSEGRFVVGPDIVIEVLSPGVENRRRDLSVKRQLYGKYGVQEYWVVDSENRAVEIFRLTEATLEGVATLMDEDEITSAILPAFKLKVAALFNF
jgi:Uma2 family endonuclease